MQETTDPWSELRELASCKPSALAFRALAALLDTWPAPDHEDAFAFAEKLLADWPDSCRLAPWSWCKAVTKLGCTPPTWSLARALDLTTSHLTKGPVGLPKVAEHGGVDHITHLAIPGYSEHRDITYLYHRAAKLPSLKSLRAVDRFDDAKVRALAGLPLWETLESFEIEDLTESLLNHDASRIVPDLPPCNQSRHLTLRAQDLVTLLKSASLPRLRSVSVFVRDAAEAKALASRPELSRLTSLSLAFRCGFDGSSPVAPSLGNVIEADDEAAEVFFAEARLDALERLGILGYHMGYWAREGMGAAGLRAVIASGLVPRLKHLRLELLPLGDSAVIMLAPELSERLETLELIDVYCKGPGAAALSTAPCASSLQRLDLSGNRIDSENVARLADVSMPRLRELDLSGPEINPYYFDIGQQPVLDAGATAVANGRNAQSLERLGMSNCFLTDAGLEAVFNSVSLDKLCVLDLSHSTLTASGLEASVGSSLWRTLEDVRLDDCLLDDDAIEVLTRVRGAQTLRSVGLAYNSIGPRGARALAAWPVLSHVWHLDLHDNAIGDEGLEALAVSPNVGKLVELDLEQDCWNSRTFDFRDETARKVAESTSLSRLDAIFSGCVDEYHGCAYSPGFSKVGLDSLRRSASLRPAARAACSDFSGISDYLSNGDFVAEDPLNDRDFRSRPRRLVDEESEDGGPGSRQVRFAGGSDERDDGVRGLDTVDVAPDDPEELEGISHRDPTPRMDHVLTMDLSLEDEGRPLPEEAGRLLSDTVDRVLRVRGIGYCEVLGSSTANRRGELVTTDLSFRVGIKGELDRAFRLIREAALWVQAPADVGLHGYAPNGDLREYPLNLEQDGAGAPLTFLQLCSHRTARWKCKGETKYRLDRVPLPEEKRSALRSVLEAFGATEPADDGWVEAETEDGGTLRACVARLDTEPDFDTLNLLVGRLSPRLSELVHRLMSEGGLMLLPMAFAADLEVARTVVGEWPRVTVVETAAELHELLVQGPHRWWSRATSSGR